ncbi:MAG: peptidylprolyl isomerase [Epsilonproteobacteria bacterium]|nr:MAG: peptidylprolyl isomerase [Campylobacterota bacterium]
MFTGCSSPTLAPVKVEQSAKHVSYLRDVKPILDKRCVTCHSCYNSPCQTKFSSFDGVDRGGSKQAVYDALRLKAQDPTRLFIDAQSTPEWREKGFYSVTEKYDANESYNDSIMMQMLYAKEQHPDIIGSYDPEEDELSCPRDKEEIAEYMAEKPNHGMPYGLPKITDREYKTLASWLQQGAKGPTAEEQKMLTTPSPEAAKEIVKWEAFFNQSDAKHVMTARYLYEHFHLAHWNFTEAPTEYYEMVRSKTPSPEPVDLIPSLRPYDDPAVEKFYYRLVKMHSTIVHKTHMVVRFNDKEMDRLKALFIEPKWMETPHIMSYDTKISANPFVNFFQIPAASRYNFLLDHSHYIIMTFIRGPVCRGQIALNVIHDHFWLMFQDPKYDLTVQNPSFLMREADNLSMPIETSSHAILDTFSDDYKEKFEQYFINKEKLYDTFYPNGMGLESIWAGNKPSDAPAMTIYRHFNSASVQKGVVGELPRTMWVLDYSQLERIYYLLVAGYDVFGNISHQTNIRRYFDYIRMEGELNFLTYMPKKRRLEMFKSWYIGDDDIQELESIDVGERETGIQYTSAHVRGDFIENVVNNRLLKSTGIKFDNINYYREGQTPPAMPTEYKTIEDLRNGFRSLTAPGTGFISYVTDNHVNIVLVRIIMPDNTDIVGSLIVNRWHDNVNSMFNGEQSNPQKDTIDFVKGYVGSYPNVFATIHYKDLPEFFDVLKNFDGTPAYKSKFKKYFVGRNDPTFWETFEWFQNDFNKSDPINAGLFDLNRYYNKSW